MNTFFLRAFIVPGLVLFSQNLVFAKTVKYDLVVSNATVNLSGKKDVDFALQVNGSIPAPTLYFTEGDTAEIQVHNQIQGQELSIHWHGLLLPVEMDGVSYVTTAPILEKGKHVFRFPIRQAGTYWYHSHTGLQEQKGVYGAIVIYPKSESTPKLKEEIIILSDWSDENPDSVLKNIKKDGEYYRFKKSTLRSIWGAYKTGSLGVYFGNEWNRMGGMDLSDIGYDAFLINGKRLYAGNKFELKNSEKMKLRIINAGASTYFYVQYGNRSMKVLAADGMNVQPFLTSELFMGMAETYDVLVDVDPLKKIELRATAQDQTGHASAFFGPENAEPELVADRAPLNLYESMDHEGHGQSAHEGHGQSAHEEHGQSAHEGHLQSAHEEHGQSAHEGHGHHQTEKVIAVANVDEIQSVESTAFPAELPRHRLKLVLGGDMERYVWHINGKVMVQDSRIPVRQNEVVEIEFDNQTMMHHPMHLHGHFFRVLNQHKDRSPLKHTVDVGPHSRRTIQFLTTEPGQWLLHCHNLYHMKTGMTRIVDYIGFQPSAEIKSFQEKDPHLHDHWYMSGRFEGRSNYVREFIRYSNTWNEWNLGFTTQKADSHTEPWKTTHQIYYRRWLGNFYNIFASADGDKYQTYGAVGLSSILPMLVEAELSVNVKGKFGLHLEKKFQWTSYWNSHLELEFHEGHEAEGIVSLDYRPNWHWSFGLKALKRTVGAGLIYHF